MLRKQRYVVPGFSMSVISEIFFPMAHQLVHQTLEKWENLMKTNVRLLSFFSDEFLQGDSHYLLGFYRRSIGMHFIGVTKHFEFCLGS